MSYICPDSEHLKAMKQAFRYTITVLYKRTSSGKIQYRLLIAGRYAQSIPKGANIA